MPEKIIKAAPPENDPVKKPGHYTYGRYECIDIIEDILAGASGPEAFLIGNAIKYLWRFRHKNGTEDLEKARWYLDRAITRRRTMAGTRANIAIIDVAPAAWENRPIYNKTTAESAARHIGEMGEFFDGITQYEKRFTGRLVRITPAANCPFTGLVSTATPGKYKTMPYAFFSPFPPEPPKFPETGADENPQEKPDA